jgi:hypothetical protein
VESVRTPPECCYMTTPNAARTHPECRLMTTPNADIGHFARVVLKLA